jgi:hypothetical protein
MHSNFLSLRHRAGSFCIFVVLSVLGILFVYRDAVWNRSLLAPLDLAPELYSKFRWMDTNATGVPQNHYIIDIFDYELPRQFIGYQALNNGVFPWWDPYSHGGRPLISEGHISFTDPLRLILYKLLPFEAAYNSIRLLHSFLLGLAAFVLLTYLGCSPAATLFGALSFQFAGPHAIFFFHAHLQASFLYYPFLWILWASWLNQPRWWKLAAATLCCGGVFASGNQQSHAYLPLFALCFSIGYAWNSLAHWRSVLTAITFSGFGGALLAAPFLGPQIELFLLCNREVLPGFSLKSALAGPLSLAFFFPWSLGTFRTFDLGRIVNQNGLGFVAYLGTAASFLAVVTLLDGAKKRLADPAIRTSFLLIVLYFGVICCTPLLTLLYTRASGLALLGLVVCAAKGFDLVASPDSPNWCKTFLKRAAIALALIVTAINVFAFLVYPRVLPRVKAFVLERATTNVMMDHAPALRSFQAENLPNEITIANPETVLALASAVSLLLFFSVRQGFRTAALPVLLLLNIAPLLLFAERFIIKSPMQLWHALLQGGPEQKRVLSTVGPFERFTETAPGRHEYVFPGVTCLYYKLHNLVGYSSFPLAQPNRAANHTYSSPERGLSQGVFPSPNPNKAVRFVWKTPNERAVEIKNESLNTLTLEIGSGAPGPLLRTDTYYPGWRVRNVHASETHSELANNAVEVPSPSTTLHLEYRPSFLGIYQIASGVALLVCCLATTSELILHVKKRLAKN